MRDLMSSGAHGASSRSPKGLSFEIADLALSKGWADHNDFIMVVRLDHAAAVGDEYEEVIAFQTKMSPLYRLIMWRSATAVFVQPLVGVAKQYDSVSEALRDRCRITECKYPGDDVRL
jgi:hypothetical protein